MKLWPAAFGIGAAAGAVAILMMPRSNPTRRLATQAAEKVEGAMYNMVDKVTSEMGM